MEYRRFGKTEKEVSVITLGGMRFEQGEKKPYDFIPEATLNDCVEAVKLAFQFGINHIETAHGYGKSERVYGIVLHDILNVPRQDYLLMTKGMPATAADTRRLVEEQLRLLKTDYFDFYAWHGINNRERYRTACKRRGPVEELLKLKEEGVIHHVGFSTHAPYEVIIESILTGFFDFVNLHYYYFFQRNIGAIALAQAKDLGVFIISPNDKGGQLFNPPEKLRKLTAPLSPIQWNARFCLKSPAVHTLSFGITQLAHFEEMAGIFPTSVPMAQPDQKILCELDRQRMADPYTGYDGYDLSGDPSDINIPEILRMRTMWKCYDMLSFGQYRYNLFEETHHWFPGRFATDEHLDLIDYQKVPTGIPLRKMLKEAHKAFYTPNETKNS